RGGGSLRGRCHRPKQREERGEGAAERKRRHRPRPAPLWEIAAQPHPKRHPRRLEARLDLRPERRRIEPLDLAFYCVEDQLLERLRALEISTTGGTMAPMPGHCAQWMRIHLTVEKPVEASREVLAGGFSLEGHGLLYKSSRSFACNFLRA